jgi:DNA polymerase-1
MGTLLLLDGNSLVNRAYYGVKSTTSLSTADGTPTNAVFGFVNILNKHLEDIRPDKLVVAFDTKAPTFRHTLFEAYKGTRSGMPDELAVQMPLLKQVLDAMRIPRMEQEGLEADDFIGILPISARWPARMW